MIDAVIDKDDRFRSVLDRLSSKSIDDYYNPYRLFQWPEALPENMWWMSPELTTTHGSESAAGLDQERLYALSRYESLNFYSLNVHGIRKLLIEVVERIHSAGFESSSEFFHHFIGEENEHMWFFAEFCLRYGEERGIYQEPGGGAEVPSTVSAKAENLLVFARVLIFEELVDHFNARMAVDERLHETIRAINRIHHQDESRHIAFGRELVDLLYADLRETATEDELHDISTYLRRYITHSFESLYNPRVYRDAGVENPYELRAELLASPARAAAEQRVMRKTVRHLEKTGLLR
jgi:AraC-like DNA-binding protein